MGYIKKLKNNELVGGTDKTTIYPVTSAEAVFEEVIEDGESNFKSQKFLNNNITGDRINEGTITDYNIAVGTVTKGKLTPQVQTMLDEGQKKALTPKGNYNLETEYEALDLVFDPVTNSSYISLVTPNVGHPVDENAEGYEEGWWEKTLDGTAVNTAQAAIDAKVGQLETQVGTAITQAETAVDEAKQETLNAYTQAEALAQQITDWSSSEISSTPSYTDQHPLSNRASSAQVGYFECGTSSATQASNQIKAVTAGGYALPTSGGAVKIKMYAANTYTPTTNNPVKLQFNADATTLKELRYNDEAVSPNNTWDAGEVISVYYDGTYYQASNAQGGSNRKTDAYLLGDLRNLALGQTYVLNEAVKTIDKQFLRMNKEIAFMRISDTVSEGDLKVYNNKTYQAQKSIAAYAVGVEYEDGDYAFGSPAKLFLTIARTEGEYEDGTIDVTIGEETNTITVLSTDTPTDIAGSIAAATWSDWYVSVDNSDVENIKVIAISKRAEVHTASDIQIATNELGIIGTGTAISGGNTTEVRKYNATNNVWSSTNLNDYSADTSIWVQVTDISELLEYTVQDTVDNLSFGSGKTKTITSNTTYKRPSNNIDTDTVFIKRISYFNNGSDAVGSPFLGTLQTNSQYTAYKIAIKAKDVITFLSAGGSNYTLLVNNDGIVTKKVSTSSITVNLQWNVEEDGWLIYNGPSDSTNRFKISRAEPRKAYSIEHLTPVDNLVSLDSTVPLSANQGRILAERTQIVKNLIPEAAVWSKNKTTKCSLTNTANHCMEYSQTNATPQNYLAIDLSGLENEKTYTLKMVYTSTCGATSPLRRFSNISDTDSIAYNGGNIVVGTKKEYEFSFKFYSNKPYIGWNTASYGGYNIPWHFIIHSISISETYTLEDIYEMASKAGSVENPDEETLRQLKYRTQTNSDNVITTRKNVTLLHFSDIHGDSSAAHLIKAYYDKYSDYIDDIIDTGDDVVSIGNEDISFINNSGLGVALRTLGNHDAWYSAMNTWGNRNTLYNKFFKPFIANWGTIVQPDDAETNGLMYWYKDYDVAPVRIIGLDTNFYDGTMIGNPSQYTLDQIAWLQSVLADAQNSGKIVVMLSHYIPAEENGDTAHVQYNGAITTFSSMRKLSANNGSQLFYGGFMDAVKPYKDIVACWICGHKHDDILFHPIECDDMLVSVINKAGRKSTSTDIVADRSGEGQICANVVAIDPTNKLVKFFRVGLRKDKWMRPINVLTYNYSTKEVITNY